MQSTQATMDVLFLNSIELDEGIDKLCEKISNARSDIEAWTEELRSMELQLDETRRQIKELKESEEEEL